MKDYCLKLCFIVTSLDYGGAQAQVVRLAITLRSRGWNICVVSMLSPQAFVEELSAAGISLYSLDMCRGVPDPRSLSRLAGILRRERPQVVHSHMVHANLLTRLVRPLVRVPVLICTAHNINEGGRLRELSYRLTDFLCDLTTQVSQAGLERYVRKRVVPRKKIRFVPNGIDTTLFRPNPEARGRLRAELGLGDSFVWLAVGRFEEAKDYPNMLRAFAQVKKDWPEAVLLIAGQGPLMGEVQGLAAELGLGEDVRFLGVRKDVPQLMNAADAYVMSSAWEGMPMVLLEAHATGLPIVATDVGGNREVVQDGKTGFLVPLQDAEALAQAMLRLMALPEENRKKMGLAGREYVVLNYDLEKVVNSWEEIYRDLFQQKKMREEHDEEV